jgi:pyruvate/2-oxoglutarate dehydrogenase complex dihydrolipoamide acyltransferase (E2) component
MLAHDIVGSVRAKSAKSKLKRKKGKVSSTMAKTFYKFLRNLNENEKLAPQAKQILAHIGTHNGEEVEREALIAQLAADAEFKTKQPHGRVVGYYQEKMKSAGLIEIREVLDPKPEKPKKEKKAPAAAPAAEGSGAPTAEPPAAPAPPAAKAPAHKGKTKK